MKYVRTTLRLIALIGCVAALGAAGWFGYEWYRTVPLEQVKVDGAVHADSDEVLALAGVDSIAYIFDATPELVEGRVRRHPWVREADVTRWPNGTLAIRVEERTPILLSLDARGRPVEYIDAEGFAMPYVPDPAYNVPLLRGPMQRPHPLRPVADERIQKLAAGVAELDEGQQAILSEFVLRGDEIWLRTTVTTAGQSLEVRLGEEDFEEKMRRLHAFWHQAVLTQPDVRFEHVDLRFDSQIITRERPAEGRALR